MRLRLSVSRYRVSVRGFLKNRNRLCYQSQVAVFRGIGALGKTDAIRQILSGLYLTGLDRMYERFDDALGLVLTFHHVRNEPKQEFAPNAHLCISPEFLEATIQLLRKRDIEIISIDEACARIAEPQSGKRFAVLTFDDGYRDNFEIAYPILKKYEAPFTIYVATGLIERTADLWWRGLESLVRQQDHFNVDMPSGPKEMDSSTLVQKHATYQFMRDHICTKVPELDTRQWLRNLCWLYKIDLDALRDDEMMSWQQIEQLARDPLCTIGAHTINHKMLSRLTVPQMRGEIIAGAAVLETVLGQPPKHFSYPYGSKMAAGPREFELVAGLNFHSAVTTRPGMIYADHKDYVSALPRISVNGLFQRLRYLAPLTSGLPTRLANTFARINVGP